MEVDKLFYHSRFTSLLFPFNRRWRLRADVVHNAIDSLDLVHDPARDTGQKIVRQAGPIGGHAVSAFDGSNGDGVFIRTLITHPANALNGQEHRKTLPESRVPSLAFHFFRHNRIRSP